MTKLTIQLDGKIYEPNRSIVDNTLENLVVAYINAGDLVELQPQEENSKEIFEKLDTEMQRMCQNGEKPEPQFYVGDIDISTGKPFKSGRTTHTYSTKETLDFLKLEKEHPEVSNEWAVEAGRDFAKKHLSQPIEKLPTFEYLWKQYDSDGYEKTVYASESDIGRQLELLTSTLNTIIERINK